jgi:hypothetical protein
MAAETINITTRCVGIAWDVAAAAFDSPDDPGGVLGVEITDLGGHLRAPAIGIFVSMEGNGRKAFLSASQARECAAELLAFADLLDAGATTAAVQ